jgi:hypothetical protein
MAHLQVSGRANQNLAQVKPAALTVEALQAFNQRRRDNQRDIGIAVGIANQQAGALGNR